MKTSLIPRALKPAVQAKRPVALWGPPGTGKSDLAKQLAAELELEPYVINATTWDPVDVKGCAWPDKERDLTTWLPPDLIPQDRPVLLIMEELPDAPPLVQSVLYQLMLERRVDKVVLHPESRVICCGNRVADRATAGRLSTALANRLIHLEVETDIDAWVCWANQNGILPEVVAFLRFRPELLHDFDPSRMTERAFPSPRSWHMLSDVLKNNPDPEIELELFAGIVGNGAAAEFVGFLRICRSLPNPRRIIQDPAASDVPSDGSTLYAICAALVHLADDNTFSAIVEYATRLPAEFGVLLVRDATDKTPALKNTAEYISWVESNQNVLVA